MNKNKLIKIVSISSGVLLFSLLGLYLFLKHTASTLPQINTLADYNPPVSSFVYSKDGHLIMEFSKERRSVVKKDEIPKKVVDAFLSAEDDNFFEHKGVDYFGIFRAFIANLRAGKVVQGGSTITQQVAKSLLLSKEKTILRKIKDFMLAQRIEEKFTKDEILLLYLNQVYLGGGFYGVKSAVEGYFGKTLDEATVAESALIAGLLVAPGKYSPYVNPAYAKIRQRYVLKRMFETKRINSSEYKNAINEDIKFQSKNTNHFKAKYFSDWILQRMINQFGEEALYTKGFEVITTLNWELQQKAEESMNVRLKEVDRRQGYRGALRNIEIESKDSLAKKVRAKAYDENSIYFVLKADGTKKDEFYFDLLEFEKWIELRKVAEDQFFNETGFLPGNSTNDILLKILKTNKLYEAVVLEVNDQQKFLVVSVGGLIGVVTEKNYKWALMRRFVEKNNKIVYYSRPGQVFKAGDVIGVKLERRDISILKEIPLLEKTAKAAGLKKLKEQSYAAFSVDQVPVVQGAVLSINPASGEILSMIGGQNFDDSKFNRAVQSNRQPGSAFKPLIYAAGLEEGFLPSSIILDTPEALDSGDLVSWKPKNYDGEFKGPVTFREALEDSRNIPTIKILKRIGVEKTISFMRRFGLQSDVPRDLSISLGSFGVSLIDLVRAYAIFPNSGRQVSLKSIISVKDRDGKLYELNEKDIAFPGLEDSGVNLANSETSTVPVGPFSFKGNLSETQRYDPRLAFIMTQLLKGVIQSGTGHGASGLSSNIAGKTGTTNEYIDAWFVGFSPTTVAGVWVGYDDNKSLGNGETGARAALPIWMDYMSLALEKLGDYDFSTPQGVQAVRINKKTGKLLKEGDRSGFLEYFVDGLLPGNEDFIRESTNKEAGPSILGDDDYYNNQ